MVNLIFTGRAQQEINASNASEMYIIFNSLHAETAFGRFISIGNEVISNEFLC